MLAPANTYVHDMSIPCQPHGDNSGRELFSALMGEGRAYFGLKHKVNE